MKKNKAMRLASALLVLTLLTTCAISSTFAKYVTEAQGTDKARVAYWGFDQAPAETTIDLFDGVYTNVQTSGDVDGFSNVIAPGTEKSTTFAFGYTNYKTDKITAPEVAYTFTVIPTIEGDYDELDNNENFKWTLKKGDATPTKYNTVDELLAAIKALSGDPTGTKTYQPGQLPGAFTSADEIYTIGWKWDFADKTTITLDPVPGGGGFGFTTDFDVATPEEAAQQDATDTAMGNSQTLEHVTFTIAITATQVD